MNMIVVLVLLLLKISTSSITKIRGLSPSDMISLHSIILNLGGLNMRKTITVEVEGTTLAQAKGVAYTKIKDMYRNNVLVYGLVGSKELRQPKPATTCKTDNNPPNGARKFITVHNIYAIDPANDSNLKFIEQFPDKTTAVKRAKELALQYQSAFAVKVEKELENKLDHICAIVRPNAKLGKWSFDLDIEIIQ